MKKRSGWAVVAVIALSACAEVRVDESPDRVEVPLAVPFKRIGTLIPRGAPDPQDEQWMIGCEVLDRDFTRFSAYKDFLPQLGIRSMRLQGGWAKCEKEKGRFDFAWLDACIDFARTNGLNPVLETGYGNPIYTGGGGRDLAAGFPWTEEGLAAWDRWVDALSKHFKGRVRDWAMWNEPDIGNPADTDAVGGHHTPENIAAFNVRTAKTILKNIADARIAGLSLATTDPDFNERCYKALGTDVGLFWRFIYHGYTAVPETAYANVEKLKAIRAKYAPHAALWQGENGAPSEMPGDGLALNHIAWSEITQAKWNLRRMLGDYVRGIPSSVFTICDYYHPGRGVGSYGLLRADSARNVIAVKRAFYAVQNAVTVFDSRVARKPRRVSSPENSLQLWDFERDGAPLFVFWTTGEWRQHGGAWKMNDVRPMDDCSTRPAVIEWAGVPLEDPVWLDLMTGRVYAYPKAKLLRRTDGTTFLDVPVYDSPCVLTERRALKVARLIEPDGECDMTARVLAALDDVKDGETLAFKKGEYHFYGNGAKKMWLDPSNNKSGEKKVLFPLVGRKGITIDGGGSTFVFHGKVFPFAATNCTGVTIRNLTTQSRYPEVAAFKVVAKKDDGFLVQFADGVCPYRMERGCLIFKTEGEETGTTDRRLSLHAIRRVQIHFLFAGETTASFEQIPASFVRVDAEDRGSGKVFFRYRSCDHKLAVKCPYAVGDPVVVNLAENRDRMGFFFENCLDVTVENVTMRRGVGMGIVAQATANIELRKFDVVPEPGEEVTLTADAVQFVNCCGKVLIENCDIGHTLDDVINIHGNYLLVEGVEGRRAKLRVKHKSHEGFFPYRKGDTVEFIAARTRDVLATAKVVGVNPDEKDRFAAMLEVDADISKVPVGTLVENATLNPDVTLRNNHFHDHPNIRLSGRGKYLIEKNRIERSCSALLGMDLLEYWYESGRISDMTIRDNDFVDCNAMGGGCFITFGVSGWNSGDPNTPKIHGKIHLENNRFEKVRGVKVSVSGVKEWSEQ